MSAECYSVDAIMPPRISLRKSRRVPRRTAGAVEAADVWYVRVIEPPTNGAAEPDQLAPLDHNLPGEEAPVAVSAVQPPVAAEEVIPARALALGFLPLLP